MIIVKFQGGLGNQMFQYAFYKSLLFNYPKLKIKADISDYTINKYHQGFELKKIFNINIENATKLDLFMSGKLSFFFIKKEKIRKILEKLYYFLYIILKKINFTNYECIDYSYNSLVYEPTFFNLNTNKDYYLIGYWQNELYFINIKNMIITDFYVPNSAYLHQLTDLINASNSVSIHIRRGDYVNTGFDVLSIDYYKKSIELIFLKIENPLFIIFSDDVEYVEKYFSYLNRKYIITENRGNNSYKDMLLMSLCKHNIISNSTFSFWGAFLNKNLNKIIFAPNIFSTNTDLYLKCNGWNIIEV